ncbi:MAG: hypothetical protein H0U69_05575 [Trueperaceae bacterium]|nr:hypothetical protein [Trueperaceae bacterium]
MVIHSDTYCDQLAAICPDETERDQVQEGIDWVLFRDPDAGLLLAQHSHSWVLTVRGLVIGRFRSADLLVFVYRENNAAVLAEVHELPDL